MREGREKWGGIKDSKKSDATAPSTNRQSFHCRERRLIFFECRGSKQQPGAYAQLMMMILLKKIASAAWCLCSAPCLHRRCNAGRRQYGRRTRGLHAANHDKENHNQQQGSKLGELLHGCSLAVQTVSHATQPLLLIRRSQRTAIPSSTGTLPSFLPRPPDLREH